MIWLIKKSKTIWLNIFNSYFLYMFGLYVHIPFCERKCKYCSFNVIPTGELKNKIFLIDNYLNALKNEIKERSKKLWWEKKQKLATLYFGGGTPSAIGKEKLIKLIDFIWEYFDLENLWELSIELNPFPPEEILELIDIIQKRYKKFPRIRWSIWLQTFDSDVLEESGRMYSFPAIRDFLRELQKFKAPNFVFNFDFIAFGKFNKTKKWNSQLWDQTKLDFLYDFVNSGFPDSFSIYTLELFSGSEWFDSSMDNEKINCKKYGDEDDVYTEFSFLKDLVLDAGFKRYEISNFSATSKSSIHNNIYWNMENYIWVGTSASSFIKIKSEEGIKLKKFFMENFKKDNFEAIRRTNTLTMSDYIKWNGIDERKISYLNEKDLLIESFFLWLRTNKWIENLKKYETILVKNRKTKLQQFQDENIVILGKNSLILTDQGMDVYNGIITELLEEV